MGRILPYYNPLNCLMLIILINHRKRLTEQSATLIKQSGNIYYSTSSEGKVEKEEKTPWLDLGSLEFAVIWLTLECLQLGVLLKYFLWNAF